MSNCDYPIYMYCSTDLYNQDQEHWKIKLGNVKLTGEVIQLSEFMDKYKVLYQKNRVHPCKEMTKALSDEIGKLCATIGMSLYFKYDKIKLAGKSGFSRKRRHISYYVRLFYELL